jgi:hypothetical protein
MAIEHVYTSAVHRHFNTLFANWQPIAPISLGDFGTLRGSLFQPLGNIAKFGVAWKSILRKADAHYNFVSSKSVSVMLRAAGQAGPSAKARLEVGFGRKNGVYLDAAGCSYRMISDKHGLGNSLRDALGFNSDWAVVTDLIVAKRSVIAVSEAAGANVVLEATGSVPAINMANAEVGLSAVVQQDIGLLVGGKRGLTPLIGLSAFRKRFFGIGDFETFSTGSAARRGAAAAAVGQASDLEFVQLT